MRKAGRRIASLVNKPDGSDISRFMMLVDRAEADSSVVSFLDL